MLYSGRAEREQKKNMVPAVGPSSPLTALSAFHSSNDPGTERDAVLGSSGEGTKGNMVRVGDPTLNQLFDVLTEWNTELEALDAPELNNLGIEP